MEFDPVCPCLSIAERLRLILHNRGKCYCGFKVNDSRMAINCCTFRSKFIKEHEKHWNSFNAVWHDFLLWHKEATQRPLWSHTVCSKMLPILTKNQSLLWATGMPSDWIDNMSIFIRPKSLIWTRNIWINTLSSLPYLFILYLVYF